jgi:DNA polymerase III epsilon subunit-like protein
MKNLWFDCETTGLDPKANDILTLALKIYIDGELKETKHYKMQPLRWDNISPEALAKNHLTLDEIKTFQKPSEAFKDLKATFCKYIDPFMKNKPEDYKFRPGGYNVGFDINFLTEFFKKNGDNFIGSFLDYHKRDVMQEALLMDELGLFKFPSFKLENVAPHLEVAMENAHDAMCDVETTIKVHDIFIARLQQLIASEANQNAKA